ncbi:hypothetical protein [Streptomyces lydicus]|uniref:hypothetical protein n=1 Tax=Streptomyces lydicus TaxID=47763 RepID=UPI001011C8C0|nr:hypothetical protein [Streptomyces lydicus]MCZ1012313.1 hypothetical protein [Streptomyces lydicus]
MSTAPHHTPTTARSADVHRQARRLEAVVNVATRATQYVAHHTTSAKGLAYAAARIATARSAANRLLNTPGLRDYPQAVRLLKKLSLAEATLSGPRAQILAIAHAAHAAARAEPDRKRRATLHGIEADARGLLRDADLLNLDNEPINHLKSLRIRAARGGLTTD